MRSAFRGNRQAALGRSIFRWVDTDGSLACPARSGCRPWRTQPAGRRASVRGLASQLRGGGRGRAQERRRRSPLAATLTIDAEASHTRVSSPNVVGVLKGSDPSLARTSVVLTAHLDHIGVRPDGDGDRINNGAYDNATGSAIVLEVARVLAAQPTRPKRSVVIVLVTAEEKGLLGSDYFAHHPVNAAGRMIAAVNLDMPVFLTASSDIVAFGSRTPRSAPWCARRPPVRATRSAPTRCPSRTSSSAATSSLVKKGVPAVPGPGIHGEGPIRERPGSVRAVPGRALSQAER